MFCHSKHGYYGSYGLRSDDWRRQRRNRTAEHDADRRARRRAAAELGFHTHFFWYVAVNVLLAVLSLMTFSLWFLWPVFCWGFGVFAHYMAVFGRRLFRQRYFDPAVEREIRREKAVMTSEKQASIDELSSTIAHEIRNPIAAAKSLVQQMGEDPTSVRERRVRQGGARRARASGALDLAPPQVREGGGLQPHAGEPRDGGRLGADPDARQARRGARARGAQLHLRADHRRRRREAPPGVRQRPRQRDRRARRRSPRDGASSSSSRTVGPTTPPYASSTTAPAFPPTRSDASSIRSSRPRRRAPGSAWRSRGRSSRRTRARSTWRARSAAAPSSRSALPLPAKA